MTSPFEQADFGEFAEEHPAYCLTAVESDDVSAVLSVLLPRRRLEPMTWAQARAWVVRNFDSTGGLALAAAVRHSGSWTYVWEENGFQGSLVPTMTALSALGRAVSAFRNVAAQGSFMLAEGRRVVRRFEPLDLSETLDLSGALGHRERTGEPLPDEPLLDWGTGAADAAALTLLANLCGVYPEWPEDTDQAFVYFS